MKKLVLALTTAALLAAAPAMAAETMLTVNLSGVVHSGDSSIITVGLVDLVAVGNRIDVYSPSTHMLIPSLGVTTSLAAISDIVFTPPSFLTVQGIGPFVVTVDYSTSPPKVSPAVHL